jgi:hypothetical protein
MNITKNGTPITSLEDWEKRAGPKSPDQWVDDRSAKETARAWLEGKGLLLPKEVSAVLASHPAFGEVLTWDAEPEAKLRFDSFSGEPRNSDLVVHATDSHGKYLIAVEAKADEPFGETVSDTLSAAIERRLENERSNGVTRVEQLAKAILGPRTNGEPQIKHIRYQLLTACAGALCEAERCGYSRALFLIHEFITDKTIEDKHVQNANDLNSFVSRLSHGAVTGVRTGEIQGPFILPGAPLVEAKVNLFIGKVTKDIRTRRG